jgi:hypothetical protein
MTMTAKELAEWILTMISEGRLDPKAPVSTAEGFAVWEQNIRIKNNGRELVL